jgi:hypothetical protein
VGHGIFLKILKKKAPPPRIFTKIAGKIPAAGKNFAGPKPGTWHAICVVCGNFSKNFEKKAPPPTGLQKICPGKTRDLACNMRGSRQFLKNFEKKAPPPTGFYKYFAGFPRNLACNMRGLRHFSKKF